MHRARATRPNTSTPAKRRPGTLLAVLALVVAGLTGVGAHAAPGWVSPAEIVSSAGQSATAAQVVVDPAGNATAVWLQSDGSNVRVHAAFRAVGGAWTDPAVVSPAGTHATEPQVAVDAQGDAMAIWQRHDGSLTHIETASRPRGGEWTAVTAIIDEPGTAVSPQIALDAVGNATAAWTYQAPPALRVIKAATLSPGGSWSMPATLSDPGWSAGDARVAADSDGATVVWSESNGVSAGPVKAVTRPLDGAWGTATVISDSAVHSLFPDVAAGPGGHVTAVWVTFEGMTPVVHAASRPPEGAWTSPSRISGPGDPAEDPRVAVGADGTATAVWRHFDGAVNRIQSATRDAGGPWGGLALVSPEGQNSDQPAVVAAPDGGAIASWRSSGADGFNRVQSATRAAGSAWSSPTTLSDGGQHAAQPRVASDAAGNAIALWTRPDGTSQRVEARVLDATSPVLTSLTTPATARAGQAQGLAVTSYDVWSSVAAITWDFGDGTTATGDSVTHAWAKPGAHTVTVTVADAVGNAVTATRDVKVTPSVVLVPPVALVAPEITGLRLKPKQIEIKGPKRKTRTKVILRLTEDARVKVLVKRKGTKAKQKVVLRTSLDDGRSKLRLTSKKIKRKLGKRHFRPGRYKLTVKAVNAAGKDRRSVTLRVRR